ncbi:MAG: hypothetical protein ChlgKO_05380 [Chlamydiales bacterium]
MKKLFLTATILVTCLQANSSYKILTKENGTLPLEFLRKMQKDFEVDTFIETGTYSGTTTARAAKVFSTVHTIEIHPPLYYKTKKRLRHLKNVHFILGDSVATIMNYHNMCDGKAILWLDAHSSGGGTGGTPGLNVVVKELEVLHKLNIDNSIMLIDDLRGMYHLDKRQNESIRGVVKQIENLPGDYCFYSLGDIGFAFNREYHPNIQVSDLVKATTISRLYDGTEESLPEVLLAEKLIMESSATEEGRALVRNERTFASSKHPGGEVIYVLWGGLQKLGSRKYREAAQKFEIALNNHCDHWRVKEYLATAYEKMGKRKKAQQLRQSILEETLHAPVNQ